MGHVGLVSLRIDYRKVTITHDGRSVLGRGEEDDQNQSRYTTADAAASRWRDALEMKDAAL